MNTDKQKEICRLLDLGICNQYQIAKSCGLSRQRVHQLLVTPERKVGKFGGRISVHKIDIMKMLAAGIKISIIAKQYKCHRGTIHTICRNFLKGA